MRLPLCLSALGLLVSSVLGLLLPQAPARPAVTGAAMAGETPVILRAAASPVPPFDRDPVPGHQARGPGPGGLPRSVGSAGTNRVAASRGRPHDARTGRSSAWRWPLTETSGLLRRFDPPAQRWLPGHRGVDLATRPGAEVRAVGPGTVRYAGVVAGRGVVTIAHARGLRTTYVPVRASVRTGDAVTAGEVIGVMEDSGGHCLTACLHLGLLRGDIYLDPLLLFGQGQVRLLPRWSEPFTSDSAAPRGDE